MELKEIGCEDVDRIELLQDRISWRPLVNRIVDLHVL